MLNRLRQDMKLSLIVLFCVPAILAIGPFAVFRFMEGDLATGIVDSILVLALIATVSYTWMTGRTYWAGIGLITITTIGALLVAYLTGPVGLFWSYVCVVAAYFLAPIPVGVVVTMILMVGNVFLGARMGFSSVELISFAVTTLVVGIFSFAFANQTSIQARQLEELATVDPLTGAANRRRLEEELAIALADFHRSSRPHGLLMLDLDHFKEINDKYGHATGDRVLCQFVHLISAHTRRSDRVFRFGGEEFVVLLPGTDRERLGKAARHLHHVIRDRLEGPSGPVTCSIGAAELQSDDSWESWIQRADHALYDAKAKGRDEVVIGSTATPDPDSAEKTQEKE